LKIGQTLGTTFNELYAQLASAESEAELAHASKLVSQNFEEDHELAVMIIKPYSKLALDTLESFSPIRESGFYKIRTATYTDVDSLTKIAVGISFLQDYLNPIENLDEQVASHVVEFFDEMFLSLIVNDLTVNGTHYRNGFKKL